MDLISNLFAYLTPGALATGFTFRLAAIWFLWEEPMPRGIPTWLLEGQPKKKSLKEKMQPSWVPSWEQPEE